MMTHWTELRLEMARPLRIIFPGAFYHVTSRGNERKNVYKSKRDREKFLEYLESASERYKAIIHAYCLMDNHYHLLLETPLGNLPQIMQHINGAYTTYFNVKRKRSGHLFQGRYKAILVAIDEYAKELSRYIHLNPVRTEVVEIPEKYDWSSYKFYIGKHKPPEWLYRDFILGYFGTNISGAQKSYQSFVNTLANKQYESPLEGVVSSTLLGSAEFIDFIKEKYLLSKEPDNNLPALKELSERVSMRDIFEEVESEASEEQSLTRDIKLYLCRRYTRERLKDIGKHFGIGESGVSQAYRRVLEKIPKDRKLKRQIEKIEKSLNLSRMKT
jgi:REP element-mobilizing transposase RayT